MDTTEQLRRQAEIVESIDVLKKAVASLEMRLQTLEAVAIDALGEEEVDMLEIQHAAFVEQIKASRG